MDFNVSPMAGAIGPAAARSLASRISVMDPSGSSPAPIFTSVPAMIRTIL